MNRVNYEILAYRYIHGIALVPCLSACQRNGLFELIQKGSPLSVGELSAAVNANAGFLNAALQLIETAGWIGRNEDNRLLLKVPSDYFADIPVDISDLSDLSLWPFSEAHIDTGKFQKWFELFNRNWGVSDPLLVDFLNSAIVVPLLTGLKEGELLHVSPHNPPLNWQLRQILVRLNLLDSVNGRDCLNDDCIWLAERIFSAYNFTSSFLLALSKVGEEIFGSSEPAVSPNETYIYIRSYLSTLNAAAIEKIIPPALPVVDVSTIVKDCVTGVLSCKGEFSDDTPFMEMGIDSLRLTEMSATLGRQLGVEIDETAFFRYSTPAAMTGYLSSELPADSSAEKARDLPEKGHESASFPETKAVAVIGLACRFPGGVNTPGEFWKVLEQGVDAITEVPKTRWDIDYYHDPAAGKPGKVISRFGGFLDGVDMFDADFFNISPREAALMDPQQRLLLETTWEALESAAIVPETLKGSRTGVFTGTFSHDYERLNINNTDNGHFDMYFATGNAPSMMAGRVSYVLGLRGPAMAVDTACSSSLVAVHLAVKGIVDGECDIAIASGVNLILSPELSIAFSRAGMLAPDGRCKTFDSKADGYVRSEGCAVVILKPLSKAVSDGDQVFAVVRGTAVNQDGASNGLTAPNMDAQEGVIRDALLRAGVVPGDVSYVETHGTGTHLGDPIEIKAIEGVYGKGREKDNPLIIGSVKTNIGHTEAVAGIAGLIKVVLSLKYGFIPAHLHFNTPNPTIKLEKIPATIPIEGHAWERRNAKKRMAGVSSFGFSGTNAHVIVEEAPPVLSSASAGRAFNLLLLSAKTGAALIEMANKYALFIKSNPEVPIGDICFSANTGRTIFEKRLAVVADSGTLMAEMLTSFVEGSHSGVITVKKPIKENPLPVFLFTGQGSQYPEMGRVLYETAPVFRNAMDRCSRQLAERLNPTIVELLYGGGGQSALLDETVYTQPLIFAVEYALSELWRSWGITPSCVLGHSVGEYVAACVAGVFSLEDALELISARGALMQSLSEPGAMAAVFSDERTVLKFIDKYTGSVSVAAINGPEHTVISGKKDAVDALCAIFEQHSISVRILKVSHAFHSPLMEPMLEDFRSVLMNVHFFKPEIDIISNVTGAFITDEIMSPEYWINHVRRPVRFADGMTAIANASYELFLEIGPRPILSGMGSRCIQGNNLIWLPTLKEGKNDLHVMMESLGTMAVCGVAVDFDGYYNNIRKQKVMLPTYPFQRRRHWISKGDGIETQGAFAGVSPAKVDRTVVVSSADEQWKQLIYNVIWQKSGRADFKRHGVRLPDSADMVLAFKSVFERKAGGTCDMLVSEIERLSLEFIIDAFRQLNWQFHEKGVFTIDEAASRLGILSRHKRLLNRFFEILMEEGIVIYKNGKWANNEVPTYVNPQIRAGAIREAYPDVQTELSILTRCGQNLGRVLCGKADPLQLLFPDADTTEATRLYQDSPTFSPPNKLLSEVIAKLLPSGEGIRVLELGAGTGGTTARVLPALPEDLTLYMFTDVTALFLNKAKQRFSGSRFMRYRALDLEKPLEPQGFNDERYDIIIAANVLHATKNLRRTLDKIKTLLSPGGILLAVEGVAKRRWIDLIFATIEGWWMFDDVELRPSYPLISEDLWKATLLECGFKAALSYSAASDETDELFPQRLIVAVNDAGIIAAVSENRCVMIIGDCSFFSAELISALNDKGRTVIMAAPGETYQRHSDTLYTINYEDEGDFRKLLQSLKSSGIRPESIVHMCSPGLNLTDEMTLPEINQTISRSCQSALNLYKAMISEAASDYPCLYFVTEGAQPVDNDNVTEGALHAVQAPLWGLVRTMAAEHPEFHPKLIDLDPVTQSQWADILAGELMRQDADSENMVAYRRGERYLPLLRRPSEPFTGEPLRLDATGTYLITGGTGGIAMALTEWMAAQGAGEIVLISRGIPSPTAQKKIDALTVKGYKIKHVCVDVSNKEALRALVDNINNSGAKLKGVIHAAGVFDDRLLAEHKWELFLKVFAPKVTGTWNLHCLTKDMDLDFFVLFSSITAVMGTAGVGNYAAANAFMDTVAHLRRSMGLRAMSINWGPWTATGMALAVGEARSLRWAADGLETIMPQDAVSVFRHHLRFGGASICAAKIDWTKFSKKFSQTRIPPFYEGLITAVTVEGEESASISEQLKSTETANRREVLSAYVTSVAAAVLGFEDTRAIDPVKGFFQMGMDSLTSIELRNRLQADLNLPLSATFTFKYPNIGAVTGYLHDMLFNEEDKAHTAEMEKAPQVDLQSVDISDEDIDAMIENELSGLEDLLRKSGQED